MTIEQHSLHLKFDNQLGKMLISHREKIPKIQDELNALVCFPDAEKREIYETLVNAHEIEPWVGVVSKLTPQTRAKIGAEFQHKRIYFETKLERLNDICGSIVEEQTLRSKKLVKRTPIGTTYYIDFDGGHDTNNDGSSAIKTNGDGPWATLDKFCENGRSAGDKAIVRRGMTQSVSSDLVLASNGTVDNPIILEADFGDAWNDEITASETATLTFGSKIVTFAGDISGDLAAHDWIYETNEDNKEFAYEVESISGGSNEIATLYLPYKGAQAGSGKTIEIMPPNPIWNTAAGDYQANWDTDEYWMVQGLHFRGTDAVGVVRADNSDGLLLKDCIIEGNGTDDIGIQGVGAFPHFVIRKCRFYNYEYAFTDLNECFVFDSLFDGNNVAGGEGIKPDSQTITYMYDSELKNHAAGDIDMTSSPQHVFLRNCILSSATEVDTHDESISRNVFSEDHNGTIGDNRQLTSLSEAEDVPIIQSEDTEVRSGGGTTSIKCTPSTKLNTNWEVSRVLLFEYPIYAVKDVEKTYTVYFRSDDDTDWVADPLNTELWIEAEYWGHATNVHRKLLKSTGVCNNFDADDTVWDSLTVTVTPLQTGVLYLRGYYAKTKEAGSNIFYTDTKIGIA